MSQDQGKLLSYEINALAFASFRNVHFGLSDVLIFGLILSSEPCEDERVEKDI